MGYSIWDQVSLIQLEKTTCRYLPIISSRTLNKNMVSPSPSQPYLLRGERSGSVPMLTPGQPHLFVIWGIRTVPFLGSFWEESVCCLAKSRISHWAHLLEAYWWYSCEGFSGQLLYFSACSLLQTWGGKQELVCHTGLWWGWLMCCCHWQHGNLGIFVLGMELMNGRNLGGKSQWQARARGVATSAAGCLIPREGC